MLVAAVPLIGGCGTGGAPSAAPGSPSPTTEVRAPSPSPAPATTGPQPGASAIAGKCAITVNVGTGVHTAGGDDPKVVTNTDRLFVSCAGAAQVQLRVDREQPALILDAAGTRIRLVQGGNAIVGPYKVTLIEQTGSGGRQLSFELALAS